MPETVRAIWRGPFVAQRGLGSPLLQPGDEADVLPAELESSHWEAVTKTAAKTAKGDD